MGAIHQTYRQEMFCNWIGGGKRCVALHKAGYAVAVWLIRLGMQVIVIMDESGYVAGERVHETQCLGATKHGIIHNRDLRRLRESKSGVVGHGSKVIPFVHHHTEGIRHDATETTFVVLAGPVSEVLYENNETFNRKCPFPHRYDMANINDMFDLVCATNK